MAAETTRLREWLERDCFWHSISKKAIGIIQGLQGVYDNLPRDTKFFEWLDLTRDMHQPFMFHGEASTRKILKKESEKEDLMEKPTRRMIYRYVPCTYSCERKKKNTTYCNVLFSGGLLMNVMKMSITAECF